VEVSASSLFFSSHLLPLQGDAAAVANDLYI
jgi:hypothetical protein